MTNELISISEEISTSPNCAEGSLLDQQEFSQPIITLYVIIFFICLLGNSFTLIVICTHRNMRTTTNFFLANLAAADLLVAIFCILQNANHIFGTPNGHWPFGDLMCKLYVTILHSAPCTSIGILICVSLEKYIAVLHPLLSNKILTTQLRAVMAIVIWLLAWGSNLPHLLSAKVLNFGKIAACTRGFDFHMLFFSVSTRTFLTASFVMWYVIPLVTIAVIYTQIGRVLWYSSTRSACISLNTAAPSIPLMTETENNNFLKKFSTIEDNNNNNNNLSPISKPNILVTHISNGSTTIMNNINHIEEAESQVLADNSEARKKIIRLLIAIVCSFAVLTLPNHARLLYSVWSEAHLCNSTWIALLQPAAYLSLFLSSSINPILYAFISQRFRSAVNDILNCRTSKLRRKWRRTRTLLSEMPPESCLPFRSSSLIRANNKFIRSNNSSPNLPIILNREVSRSCCDSFSSAIHQRNQGENNILNQYLSVKMDKRGKCSVQYTITKDYSSSHKSLNKKTRI